MSDIYPIAVPKWGIEMVEGTITTWNKSEGDTIAKGDEVFEMESDKIVNVWDSPVDGVLRRVLVPAGDAHPVGALLGHDLAQQVLLEEQPVLRRVALLYDARERVVHSYARLPEHHEVRLGDRGRLRVSERVQ